MRVRLLAAGLLAAAATLPLAGTASATNCNPAFPLVCEIYYTVCDNPCPFE